MINGLIQWWVVGTCPLEFEAHRSVYLSKAWAQSDEVRYVHPMGIAVLGRTMINKADCPLPADFGKWAQEGCNLHHVSWIGYCLPSFPRLWRIPGSWWVNEWPFGCWLRREMSRYRRKGIPQVVVNFCWVLSWSLRSAKPDLLVYDCSDNFRSYPREIPLRVDWAESRLARLSDAVVVSSWSFENRMRRYNPNITHIVNGVTQELLDNLEPFVLAPNNRGNNKPVIIYHGATQAWRFNWKLYLSVAALCPQYEFKIYTHGKHVPTMLRFPGNVRVLEWLPPQDLCRVLEVCSLGFMPYELAEPTLSGFPLKMFEYLAAGLPVVSTRLPEVERFADCVALCDNDPGQAAALIRTAINNDSAEHRAARRSLAEKYSWPTLARQYRSGVLSRIASKVNEA